MWVATHQNLYLRLLGYSSDIGLQIRFHSLNNALVHQLYLFLMYLFLMNFTPSNLHLDSKQLVSEFSQDALSKRTR